MRQFVLAGVFLIFGIARSACGAPLIVETDPLPPEEQRTRFHLPPGFEIQLIASEPDIGQPMNLNFDSAGRLWVTHSREYPYPARGEGVEPRDKQFPQIGEHEPRDRLSVIEGIGTPELRITHFAEGLNIPIGQVPVPKGAIVYSIPRIWFCPDDDHDGIADTRIPLYGTFGNVDTHGMAASFTRWIDGWIYATHGFRNTSRVRGGDGHEFTMHSGNTFRFREDGSRIEQFTWGQVNPFGLTFDRWGNAYTADCHSMPLTGLIRQAYYSSFGKPHDGLGFGPDMIDHIHGSTGICGAAWYAAEQFPPDYRHCIFLCNPVNGQVHRDRIEFHGSSPWVDTQPDFLTCDDGWFRPVDVKLGPDGALYVADFYNCIIGHYEVPLDHPRRDRERGRIWRVVYRGDADDPSSTTAQTAPPHDLTRRNLPELIETLADPNIVLNVLALHELHDRFGPQCIEPCSQLLFTGGAPFQIACAAWLLERLDALTDEQLELLCSDRSPVVRTHAARILAERPVWDESERALAARLLDESHPMIRRAAADAVGRHPDVGTVQPLIAALIATESEDTHLRHTLRIALRNHLLDDSIARSPQVADLVREHPDILTDVALGAPTAAVAEIVLAALQQRFDAGPRESEFLRHAVRYAAEERVRELVSFLSQHAAAPDRQHQRLLAVLAGLEARGAAPADFLSEWAGRCVRDFLSQGRLGHVEWWLTGLPDHPYTPDTFTVERRPCAGDNQWDLFHSSLPRGERNTGILQSEPFPCPDHLSFHLAGHDGPPDKPAKGVNLVRLRRADTGELLAEAPAPRNDVAQRVEWNLSAHRGAQVQLELVDGDDGQGYAWLAAGRFSDSALNPVEFSPRDAAAELIVRLRLTEFAPQLCAMAEDASASLPLRIRWCKVLLALQPDARLDALAAALAGRSLPPSVASRIIAAVVDREEAAINESLVQVMRLASAGQQRQLAETLTTDRGGTESLLQLVQAGIASPRLLLDPAIKQKVLALLPDGKDRIAQLVEGLPEPAAQTEQLIAERRQSFSIEGTSSERGRALFKQHCAACHQLGRDGKKVGPVLDGIGLRGTDRLLEDILDPNRNVDVAFRQTAILTVEGKVLTGLVVREEGATVILVNNKGEEFAVPKDQIEEQSLSGLSLMPANFGELLPPADLNELVAELLRQTQPATTAQQ